MVAFIIQFGDLTYWILDSTSDVDIGHIKPGLLNERMTSTSILVMWVRCKNGYTEFAKP